MSGKICQTNLLLGSQIHQIFQIVALQDLALSSFVNSIRHDFREILNGAWLREAYFQIFR